MNRPLEALLNSPIMKNALFPAGSRYHGLDTHQIIAPDGQTTVYLARRFVPHPERLHTLQEHSVSEGERLDHIAEQYLGNPELFWRICDANRAMLPRALTRDIGRRLRIAQPEGMAGATDG